MLFKEVIAIYSENNITPMNTTHGQNVELVVVEVNSSEGPAMAQVVSRRPLTAEARVRARVNPCGICGGQSGTGTGFSFSFSVFPCQYHSTVAVQTHIIWGMRNMLT
jgi:hypothetical protein